MELRPGYKQTEVGVIPEEWEVRSIGEIAPIATGSTPPTSDAANYGDEFFFVSPADLGMTKLISKTEKRLSKKGFSFSRRFPEGSVLFVCIGSTIGKCGIASVELTSNQQINAIFPSPSFSSDFLFYSLSAAAPRIKSLAGEQAVPLINKSQFSASRISLPPIHEQRVIAEALNDVDALLGMLDQLVAKKCDLKQVAMQQLLTGQTRLPGFSAAWKVNRLADCARFFSGTYLAQNAYHDGEFEIQGAGSQMGKHAVANFHGALSVVGRVGTVGRPRYMPNGCWVNNNAAALVAIPENATPYFVYLLLTALNWAKATSVTAQPFLVVEALMQMEFLLPPVPEQTAITTVLSDMDAEITALEQRRDKTRALKQAMMQELLTGRTRLV